MKNKYILVLIIFFLNVSCQKEEDNSGQFQVDEKGGRYSLLGGDIIIDVPKGAFEKETVISVREVTNVIPEFFKNEINFAYEFLPEDLQFIKPVTVTISHPSINSQNGYSSSIGSCDIQNGLIVRHESIYNPKNNTLSLELDHFSIWTYLKDNGLSKNTNYTFRYINPIPEKLDNFSDKSFNGIHDVVLADTYRAFMRWQAFSEKIGITFSYGSSSDESSFLIEFISSKDAYLKYPNLDPLGYLGSILGRESYPAVTVYDVKNKLRKVLFNNDFTWFPTISLLEKSLPLKFNIERILTHEIGHHFKIQDKLVTNGVMSGQFYMYPLSLCKEDLDWLLNSYQDLTNIVDFATASSMISESSQELTYVTGEVIENVIKVRVIDLLGNGVPNVTVLFKITSNNTGQTLMLEEPVSMTNIEGIATLESLMLPITPGVISIEASTHIEPLNGLSKRSKSFTINILQQDISGNEFFTDNRDGKKYKIVNIGTQTWMAENLAYLPSVSPPIQGSSTVPYYYVYDYQGTDVTAAKQNSNYKTYGVLYNWEGARNSCPSGWHLPSDVEWIQLEIELGIPSWQADRLGWRGSNQGTQLKSTSGWNSNGNGTNSSGFSALPGGYSFSYDVGKFFDVGDGGYWWSKSSVDPLYAYRRHLYSTSNSVNRGTLDKASGFSVRCVKD